MLEEKALALLFPHFRAEFLAEINQNSILKTIPEDTEILREGQYIKVIPVVISGLIKVFTRYEDKELLLYYIKPAESCIMSFSASLKNQPSMRLLDSGLANRTKNPHSNSHHCTPMGFIFNYLKI